MARIKRIYNWFCDINTYRKERKEEFSLLREELAAVKHEQAMAKGMFVVMNRQHAQIMAKIDGLKLDRSGK